MSDLERPRPRVTLCAAASLDGKLSDVTPGPARFSSHRDRVHFVSRRAEADALLTGAATLRAEDPPMRASPKRRAERLAAGLRPQPLRVIVSRSLDFDPRGRACAPDPESPVLVLAPADAPADRAADIEAAGHTLLWGDVPGDVQLAAALERLARDHGLRRLLAEGGGGLAASLFAEGLVDELWLTLCPLVLGGARAPTLCDGAGWPEGEAPRMRLVAAERWDDEMLLRYRRVENHPGRSRV